MFADLKSIVDIIRSAAADYRDRKRYQGRKQAVLGMLETYFLLKDCVDEGEALIEEAGRDPVGKIAGMEEWQARSALEKWDKVIKRQGLRLRALQGYVSGQHHLTIINPALQEKIEEVIGYKMERATSLHGIGAGLFFRNMFPMELTDKERAGYVLAMAGVEEDTLDPDKIRAEIEGLRASLDEYRRMIEGSVSSEELLTWSRQARRRTTFRAEEG